MPTYWMPVLILGALLIGLPVHADQAATAAAVFAAREQKLAADFTKLLQPIIEEKCVDCHTPGRGLPLEGNILPKWNPITRMMRADQIDAQKKLIIKPDGTFTAPGNPSRTALLIAIKNSTDPQTGTMPPTPYVLRHGAWFNKYERKTLQDWLDRAIALEISKAPLPTTNAGKVQKIFEDNCQRCHNPEKSKGDFGFVTDLVRLAKDPKYVSPGKPDDSEIFKRLIATDADELMPPKKPLTKEQIAIVREWLMQLPPEAHAPPPAAAAGTDKPLLPATPAGDVLAPAKRLDAPVTFAD